MSADYDKIILGIDPGTNVMGYGVLGIKGKKPEMIVIYERVSGLVAQYLPDEMAVEAPFFGKNVQSMLKLGRAQGVAIAAALSRDVPIAEYAPLSVKQAITGSGAASKEQVANMLKRLLNISDDKMPSLLDATDALAVALTHFYESSKPQLPKGPKSWEQFIAQNPDKIVKR